MGFFLVLFWRSAVLGDILRYNSRFGVFDSRLGRRKFPFSPTTGIGRQGLDLARRFCGQTTVIGENRRNSRRHAKDREFSPPPVERAVAQPANGADLALPAPIVLLLPTARVQSFASDG